LFLDNKTPLETGAHARYPESFADCGGILVSSARKNPPGRRPYDSRVENVLLSGKHILILSPDPRIVGFYSISIVVCGSALLTCPSRQDVKIHLVVHTTLRNKIRLQRQQQQQQQQQQQNPSQKSKSADGFNFTFLAWENAQLTKQTLE